MGSSDGGAGGGYDLTPAHTGDQLDAIADNWGRKDRRLGEPAHKVPTGPPWKEGSGWEEPHNYRGWWVPVVLLLIFVLAFAHYKGAW